MVNVSLTVHHELTIQNYQRDALNIIYSSNIVCTYFNILQQERPNTSLMYTQTPRLNLRHTLTQI